MTEAARPRRRFVVRKRRHGGHAHLIYLNRIVRIDALSELVWDLCDGTSSVAEIIGLVAGRFPKVEPELVSALVSHNIVYFEQCEFLADGATDDMAR